MNDAGIVEFVRPFTMIGEERIKNILQSVETVVKNNVPGDFVEIGVWKGGAIMAMALKCKQLGVTREIHVYDTFEGMTQPDSSDVDLHGNDAETILPSVMCFSPFSETKANIDKTGYPHIEYHKGDILQTDLNRIPAAIAMLRLDTDWYALTKFELQHFEPRVSLKGVIIVDDYGHWQGCKKAVDEFFALQKPKIQWTPIDYSGIYWIKTSNY